MEHSLHSPYPDYDVLDKWSSLDWDDQTRGVVRRRLLNVPEIRFFTESEKRTLETVAERIVPQPDRRQDARIPIRLQGPFIILGSNGGDDFRSGNISSTHRPICWCAVARPSESRFAAAPVATLSAPHRDRPPCVYRGFCNYGCSTNAKSSILVTYIPRAIRAGAEVRPNAMVARIEHDPTGRATGVLHFRTGTSGGQNGSPLFRQRAKAVIVPAMPSKRHACC